MIVGLLLGLSGGAAEVALRAHPLQGLSTAMLGVWIASSVGLGGLFGLLCGGIGQGLQALGWKRATGITAGLYLAMQSTINYRFEYVLNEFIKDPKVWGGILVIGGLSMVVGYILDTILVRMQLIFIGILLLAMPVAWFRIQPTLQAVPELRLPSVLVVSMDTTRSDRLSPYGHDISMPNLEKISKEGTVFEEAVASAPITEPSHLAMFTGIAPYHSGVITNGTDLGERPALLWQTLHEKGWVTAAFISGFPLHGKYGWGQGMDVYDDDFGQIPGLENLSIIKLWNQFAVKEHALRERSADRVLRRAVPWLESHRDRPFFAFVHFYDAHGPYQSKGNAHLPPPQSSADAPPLPLPAYWPLKDRQIQDPQWLEAAYDEELKDVDHAIGQLLAALGPALDHTLVVITADHGESFTEHGYYFDHGDNLFEPSLRVPLLMRWPSKVPVQRIACPVAGVDLAPTLLGLLAIPDTQTRDGISRVQEIQGGPCQAHPMVASTVSGRLVSPPPVDHALRGQGGKLILKPDGSWNFYDLHTDPGELGPLNDDPRASLNHSALLRLLEGGNQGIVPDMDAETRAALEALGYLDER